MLDQPDLRLIEALAHCQRPVILSHVYPDGDAIGSELALHRALRQRGAAPMILNAHPAPMLEEFLDLERVIEVVQSPTPNPAQSARIERADLIVVVDTCEMDRLGCLAPLVLAASAPKLCIDHHLCSDPGVFDLLWSVPEAAAAGELVYAVIQALGVSLTGEIAQPLFVALATDTGWFRHANATVRAFELATELVSAGADPRATYSALFENSSLARSRALGRMLARLEPSKDPRVVYGLVSQADLAETGARLEELEGFVDVLKEVRGAKILALFVEVSPGQYKVSLRSKGDHNVHGLAVQFGGGGHAKAAGCRLEGAAESVVVAVLDAAIAGLGPDAESIA